MDSQLPCNWTSAPLPAFNSDLPCQLSHARCRGQSLTINKRWRRAFPFASNSHSLWTAIHLERSPWEIARLGKLHDLETSRMPWTAIRCRQSLCADICLSVTRLGAEIRFGHPMALDCQLLWKVTTGQKLGADITRQSLALNSNLLSTIGHR